PLSRGENVLAGRHAYSYVNSLSSAMQAYLTLGKVKHLRAAKNAFAMLTAQSFATGGWGPDERLRSPDSDDVNASLTQTHNSFETPCGARPLQGHAQSAACKPRLPLRRQHGARDVQHRPRRQTHASRWPGILLRGLQFRGQKGLLQ